MLGDHLLDQRRRRRRVALVGEHHLDPGQLAPRGLGGLGVGSGDDHRRPLRLEQLGGRRADACRAPRDEGDLAVELGHVRLPLLQRIT